MKTADDLLLELKGLAESQKMLNPSLWADYGFRLDSLRGDEDIKMEDLRQEVAIMKLDILKNQEKKNVALCEIEIATTPKFKEMRLQEHKVERIIEFVRLAKINSNKF